MAYLLYDAQCGFCVRALRVFGRVLKRRVQAIPLQDFVSDNEQLSVTELTKSITLVDGEHIYRGAEAIARAVPGLVVLYSVPGIRQLADWMYTVVARHRHQFPGGCAANLQ